jgi:hypothetical protein
VFFQKSPPSGAAERRQILAPGKARGLKLPAA